MISRAASGAEVGELDPAVMGKMVMAGAPGEGFLHVFELARDTPGPRTFLLVHPAHLFGSAAVDDIDGELTVVGTVDRLINEGDSFSLERHFLPGLNRTVRRAFQGEGVSGLLESFSNVLGRRIDISDLSLTGPAVLLTPMTIY